MLIFYRSLYHYLVLTLKSGESLGILDTEFLEDYNGQDGQVTLKNVATGVRTSVLVTSVPLDTPGVDNDVFKAVVPLTLFPLNGLYYLEGRCRDIAGNYTILTAVANPLGTELVIPLEFSIQSYPTVFPKIGPFMNGSLESNPKVQTTLGLNSNLVGVFSVTVMGI